MSSVKTVQRALGLAGLISVRRGSKAAIIELRKLPKPVSAKPAPATISASIGAA